MTSPRHYFWLVAKSELELHISALSTLAMAQFMSWFPLAEILQQGPILTPCHSLPLHLPAHESPWFSLSTNSIWTFLLMATLEGPPPPPQSTQYTVKIISHDIQGVAHYIRY